MTTNEHTDFQHNWSKFSILFINEFKRLTHNHETHNDITGGHYRHPVLWEAIVWQINFNLNPFMFCFHQ